MQEQPGFCSLCFTHIASALHFPAHALICAGKKRAVREPDEGEIRRMILEDRVDDVRALLENDAVPRALISIQYARSPEMIRLLLGHGADAFEYVNPGQVAIEVAGRYCNVHEFLPRGPPEARAYVAKIVALRDHHYAEHDTNRERPFYVTFVERRDWETQDWPSRPKASDSFGSFYDVPKYARDIPPSFVFLEMMWNGFLAITDHQEHVADSIYFRRYNEETLDIWEDDVYDGVVRASTWQTAPLSYFLQRTVSDPDSTSLILMGQYEHVFKGSRRARTDMSLFRSVNSVIIQQPTENMVPVTRYATKVATGLFFGEAARTEFCGTFYYLEPESKAFLKFNRPLYAVDKLDARRKLGERLRYDVTDLSGIVLQQIARNPSITLNFNLYELRDFVRFIENEYDTNISALSENIARIVNADIHEDIQADRSYYCGDILTVYAVQDEHDQPLCEAARNAGYDVVILQRMVGGRQLVTEILDTRSREESIRNLCFLE
jgi:hypothetical protein